MLYRTVTWKSVFEGILRRAGMDPRGDAVATDTGLSICEAANERVRRAWFLWEWPDWTITEERAFRQIWNNSRQFYLADANGNPDEVFYIPNVATHSLVDAAYYRVKEGAPGNPPIATPPTNTTFWEKMGTVDTYVAFDQICRRRIGEVIDVFRQDPSVVKPPTSLEHRPTENGIQIYDASGLLTVFVRYLIPAEKFTTFPYIPSRTYLRGDVVYVAAQGECYQAIRTTQGFDPVTTTGYWRRCLFPEVLAQYVKAGAYADTLKETDTSEERDPVMLQIRGQAASRADGEAEDEINRQINRLQAQGQNYHYLPFGVTVRRAGVAGLCTIPGYVLQGGGAYNYGPIAATGTGMTTISDQCETEWGYIPPPPIEPPEVRAAEIRGITPLVNGQAYIDVVFPIVQARVDWTFIECRVVNTADPTPLNIWPAIVTSKTTTGFKLQLNGLPDTDNYYLDWAISGATEIEGTAANSYVLSGPEAGPIGLAIAFMVALPADSATGDPVIVAPNDGGAGGTFTPPTVQMTLLAPSAWFTYRPSTYGARLISVTNNAGLVDPAPVNFSPLTNTYLLSGPATGFFSEPSSPFTVQLPTGGAILGAAMNVTPTDQPDTSTPAGVFTPFFVTLTNAAPSATFTYTPPGTGASRTIRTTNNGGLINPPALVFLVSFDPLSITGLKGWWKADSLFSLADGALISTWLDDSGNGRNASQSGATRPTFKVNILNGLPAVRFGISGGNTYLLLALPFSTTAQWTVFSVQKPFDNSSHLDALACADGINNDAAFEQTAFSGYLKFTSGGNEWTYAADTGAAWHVFAANSLSQLYVDGISKTITTVAPIPSSSLGQIGTRFSIANPNGHIAEILIYDSVLSSTDRQAVENYLKTKYGLP